MTNPFHRHDEGIQAPDVAGDGDITPFINKVINADSRTFLKRLPANAIDMVIMSPPYNFKKPYDGESSNDDLDVASYLDGLLKPVIEQCYRVLKPGGRMAINIQPLYSERLPTHVEIVNMARSAGFSWRTEIVWMKNHHGCATSTWGSFASPSNPYIRVMHEFIEIFDKEEACIHPPGGITRSDVTDITKAQFIDWTRGNWVISPERNMKKIGHPAVFPVELAIRLMKLYTYTTATILDPFAGSGTTGVAAALTRRKFICIELFRAHALVARHRISRVLAQRRLDDF